MLHLFTKTFTSLLLLLFISGCGGESNRDIQTQTNGEVSNTLLNVAKIAYLRASHNTRINPKEFRSFGKKYRNNAQTIHKKNTSYIKIDKDSSNIIKKMTIQKDHQKVTLEIEKEDVFITTVNDSGKQTTKMKLSKFINL